jgi:arginine-tRNA-protein transferase
MTWDPLDGELTKKLDERAYVSLSRDRKLASQEGSSSQGEERTAAGSASTSEGNAPAAEEEELINEEELSLFDIHMPGVMTAEEVESQIDLDHWLLLVEGTLIQMEVKEIHYLACLLLLPCLAPLFRSTNYVPNKSGPRRMGNV